MRKPTHENDPEQLARIWRDACGAAPSNERVFVSRTITPLYGGGVEAGKVDGELPIRPSGLRGQWRFWWRLLNRQGRSPAELFAVERALWGGIGAKAASASQVSVRVSDVSNAQLLPAFQFKKKHDGKYRGVPDPVGDVNAYALFPAQGKLAPGGHAIEERPREVAKPGLGFRLRIACGDEQWPGVQQALRWWASFGGVGARTRRGLGAVRVDGLEPVTVDEVAAAGGRLVLGKRGEDAASAWNAAVDCLGDFRQGLGVGRRGNDRKDPGRSYWPEADAIRRLANTHSAGHAPEHPVLGCYPRAAFGLPIVFQFKDKNKGDPQNSTLEPDGDFDRMASPLILRPYWDGEGYRPAALLLPGWEQALRGSLKFKGSGHRGLATWPVDTREQAATAERIHPMQGHGDDPLTAFLAFFRKGVS
ncbi:type III-B CRISPR module RAMP protein Cmr1 [Thioalkalivibrio paradoxus]|uniref:CRISPR-associated protein Cmr1 n=1 Tax=Thioalkalivibrio paradoxus ARh 1 TaxID=713585 RepID=W0DN57_9GAMM|nr:type III-B CRISPR module RAMP protein Cmr1 [Thioalkalivibrio paradoxus]AHE98428.1 CRISPR-associated protein Cmr1 [Thioalkalivibrio paradoxus ARh 1]